MTITDNGFSGRNINRDVFQKTMKLIRQGKVHKVIPCKPNRMNRSLADFADILREFKEHGVKFVSSQKCFSTNNLTRGCKRRKNTV